MLSLAVVGARQLWDAPTWIFGLFAIACVAKISWTVRGSRRQNRKIDSDT